MQNHKAPFRQDRIIFQVTISITILMLICSSIGIWQQDLYFREKEEWLAQCVGQDISNLFFIAPALLASAFYAAKGSRLGKSIWLGLMITNIYAYILYCFAVHFNYLYLIYCSILGLANFSVIYFFFTHRHEEFSTWFDATVANKKVGAFLLFLAIIFIILWLSEDLPGIFNNSVPESIVRSGLLTNPVHTLDYTLYLPMMIMAGIMLIKKRNIGYLLAPMMLVFAIATNVNIICLMIVANCKNLPSDIGLIIIFGIFTIICIFALWSMLKRLKD